MRTSKVPACGQLGPARNYRKPSQYRQFIKRRKNRLERRRAKLTPDCVPTYGKYRYYEH